MSQVQTITTYKVKIKGSIKLVEHRTGEVGPCIGASDWVKSTTKRPFHTQDPTLWIGDKLTANNEDGRELTGVVLAKEVKEWDFSRPLGQRCISRKTSKHFNSIH